MNAPTLMACMFKNGAATSQTLSSPHACHCSQALAPVEHQYSFFGRLSANSHRHNDAANQTPRGSITMPDSITNATATNGGLLHRHRRDGVG